MKLRIMNNLVKSVCVCVLISMATFAQEVKCPTWSCKDVTTWENYCSFNLKEQKWGRAFIGAALARHCANEFETYEQFKEFRVSFCAKNNCKISDQNFIEPVYNVISLRKFADACFNEFKNNEIYCVVLIPCLSITPNEKYDYCLEKQFGLKFYNFTYSPYFVKRFLDQVPLVTYDDAKVLADLKKLNRKYSVYLTEDYKDKVEPIVAKIRTIIATYEAK